MRTIERESWPRKEHFRLFNAMEFPHVSFCVQVDITELWVNRAQTEVSPTIVIAYVITKAANQVAELRQRIRGEQIIEHDIVHPLITVLGRDDIFGVTPLVYDQNFAIFAENAGERIAVAKESPSLTDFPHDQGGDFARDDLLSMTVVPWLSFTSFSLTRRPQEDTIPLLAWGKVLDLGNGSLLPLFINFHHALVDGVHIARYVNQIERVSQELAASF